MKLLAQRHGDFSQPGWKEEELLDRIYEEGGSPDPATDREAFARAMSTRDAKQRQRISKLYQLWEGAEPREARAHLNTLNDDPNIANDDKKALDLILWFWETNKARQRVHQPLSKDPSRGAISEVARDIAELAAGEGMSIKVDTIRKVLHRKLPSYLGN